MELPSFAAFLVVRKIPVPNASTSTTNASKKRNSLVAGSLRLTAALPEM
jgi:hypothetical protein